MLKRKKARWLAVAAALLSGLGPVQGQARRPAPTTRQVRILAGGADNHADGPGAVARFYYPQGVALGPDGALYVADESNNRIRRVAPDGRVSTLAGTGEKGHTDGPGRTARFLFPAGVAVDKRGIVYVGDVGNRCIRRITPDGQVSTWAGSGAEGSADGLGRAASFGAPQGLAVDTAGNVFVADYSNHCIRRITPAGLVSTLPGASHGGLSEEQDTTATLASPSAVAVAANGTVYVADNGRGRVCLLTPAGRVQVLAGPPKSGVISEPGAADHFYNLRGLVVDAAGTVYVTDDSNRVRRIGPDGRVSTVAGDGHQSWDDKASLYADGPARTARFSSPSGLALAPDGTLYVGDLYNQRIRTISPAGYVGTLAGSGLPTRLDGPGPAARFHYPRGVAVDARGTVYVADTDNHCIRKITPGGRVSTLAGAGRAGFANGRGRAARFNQPTGVTVDRAGTVYVADMDNHRIRRITPAGVVSTLAGTGRAGFANGPGRTARFRRPLDVAVAPDGTVYVADTDNNRIRRIAPGGQVSTFGNLNPWSEIDDRADGASLVRVNPIGVAVAATGAVYVTGATNKVYKLTPAGKVSLLADLGINRNGYWHEVVNYNELGGLAVAPDGRVYVADANNHRLWQITPRGRATEVAPNPEITPMSSIKDFFSNVSGVAVDARGRVYVADTGNQCIKVIR